MEDSMSLYLACVAAKYTKKALTDPQLIKAHSPYDLPRILEERTGIKVDGKETYVDWVEMSS